MKNIKRIIFGILLLFWLWVMYSFSAKTGAQSSSTSGGLTRKLLNLFYPQYKSFPQEVSMKIFETTNFILRKTAHFLEYMILAEIAAEFMDTFFEKSLNWKQALTVVILCGIFATSDEIHQMFVGGRSPQVKDVILDTIGAIVGAADYKVRWIFIEKYKNNKSNRKEEQHGYSG